MRIQMLHKSLRELIYNLIDIWIFFPVKENMYIFKVNTTMWRILRTNILYTILCYDSKRFIVCIPMNIDSFLFAFTFVL